MQDTQTEIAVLKQKIERNGEYIDDLRSDIMRMFENDIKPAIDLVYAHEKRLVPLERWNGIFDKIVIMIFGALISWLITSCVQSPRTAPPVSITPLSTVDTTPVTGTYQATYHPTFTSVPTLTRTPGPTAVGTTKPTLTTLPTMTPTVNSPSSTSPPTPTRVETLCNPDEMDECAYPIGRSPVQDYTPTPEICSITVEAGMTMWSLSRRYNVTVASIQAANNMSHTEIYVGQRLTIPAPCIHGQ